MTQSSAAPQKPFPPGMPVEPGDLIAGKYRVDKLIAVGGMGIVVRARHEELGQDVAIKVLLPLEAEEQPQSVTRFLREARAAAGLRSDHVVRIYDVDRLPAGLPYMVMELLLGTDLRRVIRKLGPQSVEHSVAYILQAADAIEEAHAAGIIHRDLKPSNLFLTQRRDGKALVKVLDFGISKTQKDFDLEGDLTATRAMIGSPRYMSPEQVRDAKSVDARSDIWSLGAILYELVTGKSAFPGDSLPAICAAIVSDPTPSVSLSRPEVPIELERVVLRCLQKEPADRFQSVHELSMALAALVPAEYVPSVPPPSLEAPPPQVSVRESLLPSGVTAPPTVPFTSLTGPSKTRQSPGTADANDETAAFRTPSTIKRQPAPSSKKWIFASAGALVAIALVALAITRPWEKSETPTPAPQPAAAKSFLMRIDSVPAGAEVREGDRVLGKTPHELRIDSPRAFVLALTGYEPYTVKQETPTADVHVRAELVALPTSTPAEKPTGRPATRAWPSKPSTRDKPTGKPPTPPTDIRLER
jgi:serine/threonine-protein kinase